LKTGENLGNGSPVLALRNQLMREHSAREASRLTMLAWFIKAWNAYLKGGKVSRLSYSPDKEEFPRFSE
jgi:hypothetical protein